MNEEIKNKNLVEIVQDFNMIEICPTCKEISKFFYLGIQEGYKKIKSFKLYNCLNCNSTVNERDIRILKNV